MAAMNNIVKMADNLPQLPRTEHVHFRAEQIVGRWYTAQRYGISAEDCRTALDALLPEMKAVLNELRALQRPASKTDIVKHLTVLVGCFSNGAVNGEIYGRTLAEYVAAREPSIGDLEDACKMLLQTRTSPFQPTIAEVLAALKEAQKYSEPINRQIADITSTDHRKLVEERKLKVAEEERRAAVERQRRAELHDRYMRGLENGDKDDEPFA
jgi:hypothetical protein